MSALFGIDSSESSSFRDAKITCHGLSQSLRISLLSFSPSLSISMFSCMGARAKSSYYAEELSSSQPPSSAASLYWPFLYLSKLFATCCASLLL